MTSAESFARIASLSVQDVFVSSDSNELRAQVEITNDSELAHSAQVVFRGYIRKAEKLVYEFLHEQAWILVEAKGTKTHEVAVDVWLPRFPPTMEIRDDMFVEYSVRATVDPWFLNHHEEKTFRVERTLVLKMPHMACYQQHIKVDRCVTHGGWYHRKCKAINGDIWVDKGAYSHGEKVKVKWQLQLDMDTKLEKVKLILVQNIAYRLPGPDHPCFMKSSKQVIASQEISEKKEDQSNNELLVPEHLPVTMAMTLWNLLTVRYELVFQVKLEGHRNLVDFNIPVIITSEPVQGRTTTPGNEIKLFKRTQDIDDDTDDDDDCDSVLDLSLSTPRQHSQSSVEVDELEVMMEKNGKLTNSYASVNFTNNSNREEQLCLRLLLQGEIRAGLTWYTFLRYKAHISSDSMSLLSPGSHSLKIPLPFKDSQYDTNILPPSMDDDIRYSCSVTTKPWEVNDIAEERAIDVDYLVDTQAKEKFKMPYSEIVGAYGIEMTQRTFQRGKYVFVTVNGEVRAVRLRLEQQRRIRIAGLNMDESYCTERVVAGMDSPEDKDKWPKQWSMRIPSTIPPSIEITYWNVLALNYSLAVVLVAEDGHEHVHNVPVWIGCTDDHLPPPQPLRTAPKKKPKEEIHPVTKPKPQLPDELPEFEVVRNEETYEIPVWVDRYTDHMYS